MRARKVPFVVLCVLCLTFALALPVKAIAADPGFDVRMVDSTGAPMVGQRVYLLDGSSFWSDADGRLTVPVPGDGSHTAFLFDGSTAWDDESVMVSDGLGSLLVYYNHPNYAADPYETDDTWETAVEVVSGSLPQERAFFPRGDHDWIRIPVVEGQRYQITVESTFTTDPVVGVFDEDGNELTSNDDSMASLDSNAVWQSPYTGFAYAEIHEFANDDPAPYRLTVSSPPRPVVYGYVYSSVNLKYLRDLPVRLVEPDGSLFATTTTGAHGEIRFFLPGSGRELDVEICRSDGSVAATRAVAWDGDMLFGDAGYFQVAETQPLRLSVFAGAVDGNGELVENVPMTLGGETRLTNAGGHAVFSVTDYGSFPVEIRRPSDSSVVLATRWADVADSGFSSVGRVLFTYLAEGIAGRVTNSVGTPLPGATVSLRSADGETLLATTTADAEGNYALEAVAGEEYTFDATRVGFDPASHNVPDVQTDGVTHDFALESPDSQAPTVTCDAGAAYTGRWEFTLSAEDDLTGVAAIEYSVDGEETRTASAESTTVTGTGLGTLSVRYRAIDFAGNASDVKTAEFVVSDNVRATLNPRRAITGYSEDIALVADVVRDETGDPIVGASVELQRSLGGQWQTMTVKQADQSGRCTFTVDPIVKTSYRVAVFDQAPFIGAASLVAVVTPKAKLAGPYFTTPVTAGRAVTVRAGLQPRHTAGTYPIRLERQKWNGSIYVPVASVRLRASDYRGYSKCTNSLSLSRGTWRLRVVHSGDSANAYTATEWARVRVR